MDGLTFFHRNLGSQLLGDTVDSEPVSPMAIRVPHRGTKGIVDLRLGQIDVFYGVSPKGSIAIGRMEHTGTEGVTIIPAEQVSARKRMAQWLMFEAEGPFMAGVISKADPVPSMTVTHHAVRTTWCEKGGQLQLNLSLVREAYGVIKDLPWKTAVAPAIHEYHGMRMTSDQTKRERHRERLSALVKKNPGLSAVLPRLGVLPGSGEYKILSWLNIASKV